MTLGTGPRANHASACRRRLNGGAGGGNFARANLEGQILYVIFWLDAQKGPAKKGPWVFSDVGLCGSASEGCPNENIEVFLKRVFCASLLFFGGFEVPTR